MTKVQKHEYLRTEHLSAGYSGNVILNDTELSVSPGEILTVIAPNGAGKSTLLKTLIRQLPALSGTVWIDGRDLTSLSGRELATRSAAVLTGRIEPERMTCEEVVSAGRYPYTDRLGVLSEKDRAVVCEAMELVNILPLCNQNFNCLSDGQRQRVLLARAIAQEPKLLVMDEPTSFLDIRHKLEFLHILKTLVKEKQIAAVLSMHELDLAQKISDTIVCLRHGRIDRIGPPEEIFAGDYIGQLFQVEFGSYDPYSGSAELSPAPGEPRVFVIGGGGRGIPVYRQLCRMGIPFAAGILQKNDLDYPVASALASIVIAEEAFEPVKEETLHFAEKQIFACGHVVCALSSFGSLNAANETLFLLAKEQGLLISVEDLKT